MRRLFQVEKYFLCGALLTSYSVGAYADEVKIGSGIDCSSGRYGQLAISTVCFYPHNLHIFTGQYEFKLSTPYVDVKDTVNITGWGDSSFYMARTIIEDKFGLELEMAGDV